MTETLDRRLGHGRRETDLEQQRYKALFDSTVVGIAVVDGVRRIVDCNAAFCRLLGRERPEVLGHAAAEFGDGVDPVSEEMAALVAGRTDSFSAERRYRRPDGSSVWVRITTSVISRRHDLYVGIVEDLSDRDLADRQLRERTALLTHAQQIGGVGSWVWYPLENRHEWSPQARRIFGFDDVEADQGDPDLFFDALHPEDRAEITRHVWDSFHRGVRSSAEYRIVRPEGETRWVRAQADVDRDASGRPVRVVGVVMDVTDRKEAEDALREKAAALERAHEVARLGSFTTDVATRQVVCSRELARLLGLTEAFSSSVDEFRDRFVRQEDRDEWAARLDSAYRCGGSFSLEARLRHTDGQTIWARVHGNVELDEFGFPLRAIGVIQDIGDQRMLEEQFHQSQKLDAVGQLASGIAHDFNNLLLVIGGNAQLALASSGEEIQDEMAEILRAAERARELIRQLLAFSRADVSEPRTLELNDVVSSVRRMLDRLLEETIEIETNLAVDPTTVYADPGQLEQVLLNLAVNARDAMPGGGRLTLTTAVEGDSVALEVTDTGVGMDDAVREHAFDPFFTTKPAGEGTGLGLSTVYGIVSRSGGRIAVDSEPGFGTRFTIALPRVDAPRRHDDVEAMRPLVAGAGERILIVEDDAMVRAVAAELLGRAGYEIETAENGEQALTLFDEGRRYDLIVSDLMMPRMTGPQLTAALRERGHTLPTVYTSGYAEPAALPPLDDPHSAFVPKPFSGEQVTSAVSALLQARAA